VLSCETHSSLYGVNAYFNYITAHVLEALSSSIQEFFKVIHSRLLPSFLVSAFASLEFRVFFFPESLLFWFCMQVYPHLVKTIDA